MNVERINEFKIMKALRYLLMVVAMVSVLSVKAQGTAQLPQAQMKSTSVMVSSGSALPQAAVTGAYMTGTTVGTYSPAKIHPGNIRKVDSDGDGIEDEEWGETEDPYATPLGDGLWVLMALAGVYALMRVILIRKRAGERR